MTINPMHKLELSGEALKLIDTALAYTEFMAKKIYIVDLTPGEMRQAEQLWNSFNDATRSYRATTLSAPPADRTPGNCHMRDECDNADIAGIVIEPASNTELAQAVTLDLEGVTLAERLERR